MIDSTVPCGLPLDNIIPGVLVVTMPLSRLPEMAEVAIAMFSPELEGPQKEPLHRRVIFANLIDHMACEGLLEDLPRLLREMSTHEAARNEFAGWGVTSGSNCNGAFGRVAPYPFESTGTFCFSPRKAVLGRNVSVCLPAERSLQCSQHRILLVRAQFARWKGSFTSCRALGARVLGSHLTPAAACGARLQCPIGPGRCNILRSWNASRHANL